MSARTTAPASDAASTAPRPCTLGPARHPHAFVGGRLRVGRAR